MYCHDFISKFNEQYPEQPWEVVEKEIYSMMHQVSPFVCLSLSYTSATKTPSITLHKTYNCFFFLTDIEGCCESTCTQRPPQQPPVQGVLWPRYYAGLGSQKRWERPPQGFIVVYFLPVVCRYGDSYQWDRCQKRYSNFKSFLFVCYTGYNSREHTVYLGLIWLPLIKNYPYFQVRKLCSLSY